MRERASRVRKRDTLRQQEQESEGEVECECMLRSVTRTARRARRARRVRTHQVRVPGGECDRVCRLDLLTHEVYVAHDGYQFAFGPSPELDHVQTESVGAELHLESTNHSSQFGIERLDAWKWTLWIWDSAAHVFSRVGSEVFG